MRITEVATINHTEDDDRKLTSTVASLFRAKTKQNVLTTFGHVDGFVVKTTAWPLSMRTHLFLLKDDKPVGMIVLQKSGDTTANTKVNADDPQIVRLIWLAPEIRSRGLGMKLYRMLLDRDIVLQADNRRTVAAQRVWDKLASDPQYEVVQQEPPTIRRSS